MSRFKSLKANPRSTRHGPRRRRRHRRFRRVVHGHVGNPANTFTAGTLTMGNSKAASAILTASNMKPGDPASTGTVDIKNTGTTSGAFTLTRGTVVDSDPANAMSPKLNVIVTDCGTDLICGNPAASSSTPARSPA